MGHRDVFDDEDSLRRPFLVSAALHLSVFIPMALGALLSGASERIGDTKGGGPGDVTISPVEKIPVYNRSERVNPLANDTESQVPSQANPRQSRDEPEPDSIALGKKDRQKKHKKLDLAKFYQDRLRQELKENQLTAKSGAKASTPMFGAPGSGGVGVGTSSPFGNRFGYYEQLLRERVARFWKTEEVNSSIRTAPPVILVFDIMRNGSVRNIRQLQSSGIPALDYSCERAIREAAPFEALPDGFERNSANVEFWFQLKR